ncbi:MAG: hypothetical protein ABIK92_06655 [Pseudomonadota bacterium]
MNRKIQIFIIIVLLALTGSILQWGLISHGPFYAHAGDKLDWEKGSEGRDNPSDGYYNILFKTENLLLKVCIFVLIVLVLYILFWTIFNFRIKQNKSPAKAFTVFFSLFMLSIIPAVFICFSEYAMLQTYDSQMTYFSQINWIYVGLFCCIWVPLSIGMTSFLKGRT